MKAYDLKVTLEGRDENGPYADTQTFKGLLQGDLDIMKETSRRLAPTGDSVTYEVTETR